MDAVLFVLLGLAALLVLVLLALYIRALTPRPGEAVEYDTPDFTRAAGFRVASLPSGELLTPGRILLRNGSLAELAFTAAPGWDFLLRVTLSGGDLEPETLPCPFEQRSVLYLGTVRVQLYQSPGGPGLCLWSAGGFDCALYCRTGEMGLLNGLVRAFVMELRIEPAE